MSNTIRKETKKNKQIKALKEELKNGEEVYKRNTEQENIQIQAALYGAGYPKGAPMWDVLLDNLDSDQKELKMKIDSGFAVVSPVFLYQTSDEWQKHQLKIHEKNLETVKTNIKEVKKNVETAKQAINLQNERIVARKAQIVEELKKLGVDDKKLKADAPDYIG